MRFLLLSLAAVLAVSSYGGDDTTACGIPDVIPASIEGAPAIWVAVDVAIQNGEFTDKVPPLTQSTLRDFDETRQRVDPAEVNSIRIGPQADCGGISMSLPTVGHYRPNRTFEDLTAEASDVVVGQVVETRQGFFRGFLGMMVRFEVSASLRRSERLSAEARHHLLLYPYATLRMNGSVYCTRPAGFSFEPRIGDRVLVFSYRPGLGPNRSVVEADASREVIFERDGRVMLPPPLRSDAVFANARTLDELLMSVSVAVHQRDREIPGRVR